MNKICVACISEQNNPRKSRLHPWSWPSTPWSRVHLDFLGPIKNKKYLILKDVTSKWIEVVSMKMCNTENTTKALRNIFSRFGLPKQIVKDSGAPFLSIEF